MIFSLFKIVRVPVVINNNTNTHSFGRIKWKRRKDEGVKQKALFPANLNPLFPAKVWTLTPKVEAKNPQSRQSPLSFSVLSLSHTQREIHPFSVIHGSKRRGQGFAQANFSQVLWTDCKIFSLFLFLHMFSTWYTLLNLTDSELCLLICLFLLLLIHYLNFCRN